MLAFRGLCTKSCVMTGRDGRRARVGASGCALLSAIAASLLQRASVFCTFPFWPQRQREMARTVRDWEQRQAAGTGLAEHIRLNSVEGGAGLMESSEGTACAGCKRGKHASAAATK